MPWRAAGVAIYGSYANTIQNFYVADTLGYSGLTISSLNFGFAFEGFGATPPTTLQNFSLSRDGGLFWGNQVFGAIWVFSATKIFQRIRVNDTTVTDLGDRGAVEFFGGAAAHPAPARPHVSAGLLPPTLGAGYARNVWVQPLRTGSPGR